MLRFFICAITFLVVLTLPLWSPGPWWLTGIGMLVGYIIIGITFISVGEVWEDDASGWALGAVIASFVLYASILAVYEDDYEVETKTELTSTTKMYSMRPFSQTSGHFFLGTGSIGTSYGYVTYVQQEDGGLKAVTVSRNATLYEDATSATEARFEELYTYERESRVNMSAFLRYILGYEEYQEWKHSNTEYKIHVPEGTVVQAFEG